jgi:hypothetical protein
MPPGPVYNWLCVVCSAADILSHAARIRASQLAPRSYTLPPKSRRRPTERKSPDDTTTGASNDHFDVATARPRPNITLADVGQLTNAQALSTPTSSATISSAEAVQNVEQVTQHSRVPSAGRPMEIFTPGIHPDKALVDNLILGRFD